MVMQNKSNKNSQGVFFSEERSSESVIARMDDCDNPRLKVMMASIINHLHRSIKEVEPTAEEWAAAIDFLTRTGQLCTDWRQEFILLSDTLGVSMLVDAINHRKRDDATTESTVLGPFYLQNAPEYEMGANICLDGVGEPMLISGRVLDTKGNPVENATLDTWQANGDGFYDVQQPDQQPSMNLRGIFRTARDGRFWFRTIKPRYYPIPYDGTVGQMLKALRRHPYRPAHVHFKVEAAGFKPVTTHVFSADSSYLDSDAVFGVKSSLIAEIRFSKDAEKARSVGFDGPFYEVIWDFVLADHNSEEAGSGERLAPTPGT